VDGAHEGVGLEEVEGGDVGHHLHRPVGNPLRIAHSRVLAVVHARGNHKLPSQSALWAERERET
jgi:hypothetical protein